VSGGAPTAKAELEMALEGRAPEGVLTSAEGRGFGFSGWTELAAAIEEWRSDARARRLEEDGGGEMHAERVR
jgi:hypothetical protein